MRSKRFAENNTTHDLIVLAQDAIHAGDLEKCLEYATEAYQQTIASTHQQKPDYLGMASSLRWQSHYYRFKQDFVSAIQLNLEALQALEYVEDKHAFGLTILNIAWLYYELHDNVEALDWGHRGLLSALNQDSEYLQANSYNVLAEIYGAQGDQILRRTYSEKALEMYCQQERWANYVTVLNNLANLAIKQKNYVQARNYIKLAQEKLCDYPNVYNEILLYIRSGIINRECCQFDDALSDLHIALEKSIQHGYEHEQKKIYFNLGILYLHQGKYDLSETFLRKTQELEENTSSSSYGYQTHYALAELFELQGDYKQALYHAKQSGNVKETYLNDQYLQRYTSLKSTHELHLAQQELNKQKQLHEEDKRYFEWLRQFKDDTLETVSHDLKNPLAGIYLSTALVRRHVPDGHKSLTYIGRIENHAEQMKSLITNILDVARLETQRGIQTETMDIIPLIMQSVEGLSGFATKQNIIVKTDNIAESCFCNIDSTQIRQVLDNLISNGIKYSPDGSYVDISMIVTPGEITVSVKDDGLGIPANDVPHIFERFYRVDTEDTTDIDGTGLGLAISYAVIQQHGGDMWVESVLGEGSTFHFSLPL